MRLLPSVDNAEPQFMQARPMVLLVLVCSSGGSATKPLIELFFAWSHSGAGTTALGPQEAHWT